MRVRGEPIRLERQGVVRPHPERTGVYGDIGFRIGADRIERDAFGKAGAFSQAV
jgi:hypothetical protein